MHVRSFIAEVVPGIDPESGKKRWMLNIAKLKASDTIVALAAGVAEGVVQRTVCECCCVSCRVSDAVSK